MQVGLNSIQLSISPDKHLLYVNRMDTKIPSLDHRQGSSEKLLLLVWLMSSIATGSVNEFLEKTTELSFKEAKLFVISLESILWERFRELRTSVEQRVEGMTPVSYCMQD